MSSASNGHINITFPDGSKKEFPKGVTSLEIASSISKSLAEDVLVAEVNGELVDLVRPICEDASVRFYKFTDDEGKKVYWHSSSHIMAQAIEELFPGAKFGVGPAIENGFYYDVDSSHKFTEDDLMKIEDKMLEIAKRDLKTQREELKREDAIEYFKSKRVDSYKVEILEDIAKDEDVVSLYHQGEFTDLCRGPHMPTTAKLKNVKLLNVSGSYWRGDSNRQQLQRIYGISFPKKKDLDDYLKLIEEAKKRDHRKLGKELELFMFHEYSPGAPFWLPNGMILFKELEKYWRSIHEENGYDEINTPILVKDKLFERSGHTTHYTGNMFKVIDGDDTYYLKPMNCPEATMVYSSKLRSYKDLPVRLSEIGRLHRNELRGAVGGLFRVRQITMDDAHIFCTLEQIQQEITGVMGLIKRFYALFNLEPAYSLATRPDEALGSKEVWDKAEAALAAALEATGLKYKLNEKEGAFYGPKIDINIKDVLKRDWQIATIQLDYNLPERFDLTFEGSDGQKHRPVMIHRAIFGSFERFIGVLIEHFAGNFPLWLSPIQLAVLPITDNQLDYAKEVYNRLVENKFRVKLDDRNEKVGYKIRDWETKKVPYMIVLGEKEKQNKNITVRAHKKGDLGSFGLNDFVKSLSEEIKSKKIN
ncbi:MAG: threonine--tRNA ligase [Chlorobi bacterium]|nr:threonine--tRNA ligase [Chlorobiota bacterium]MCI0716841.1 threonine--tRNA ligase [Chlorobiota bacterium]